MVCVPLVHVNLSGSSATQMLTMAKANAGVLYMDSRVMTVDLAGGNRELLQTLAIEASTILENARLIEEERAKQRIEEELDVARRIQQSLTPRSLPQEGWFVGCGSSESSHQVGGDYYDVVAIGPDTWSLVVADVSGKGVSSALLASFLQGAFLSASCTTDIPEVFARVNAFLNDRAETGKYATMFYSKLDSSGHLAYANAGHCAPMLVRKTGADRETGSHFAAGRPGGRRDVSAVDHRDLAPGDRIVLYSDGVTEAQNDAGPALRTQASSRGVQRSGGATCAELHRAIHEAVLSFTAGAEQADDLTLVVVEYRGADLAELSRDRSGRFRAPDRHQVHPFPARHHRGRQAVSEQIHRSPRHIHQRVDAQNHRDTFDRQIERRERAGENDQRRPGHSGHAFACQHQRQHHDQLCSERHVNARGLRHEHRGEREIERRAVQIEAVAGRQHERHDMFGHTELLHVFERDRQRRFARRRGERQQERLANEADKSPQRNLRESRHRAQHHHDKKRL